MSKKTKAEPSAPLKAGYNPDVLSCLANLSNDEVFTPPEVANAMLDLLPQKIFSDPNAKFLDPACKSGVFLREIAKRLIAGLADKIPDLQKRIDHIFKEQLYAIAITELTSLLSRRSVYCSKDASGKYSVSKFKGEQGNIFYKPTKHLWINGKCLECGASQSEYGDEERQGLESHAYQFIHKAMPGELENMKFDVIIGNPPYQMGDGGNGASAKPIYHLFIQQAKKLNPNFLTMIIPARWYSGGKGLDDFRTSMLQDRKIRILVDYFDSEDCFPGIDLSGGVCYFLWNRNSEGLCKVITIRNNKQSILERNLIEKNDNTFIRFNEAIPIINKIRVSTQTNFSSIVSNRNPFGLTTNTKIEENKTYNTIMVHAYPKSGYISSAKITKNTDWVSLKKVYISYAYGERGDFPYLVLGKPFIGDENTCCTETYLVIGAGKTSLECTNIISYIKTKFFRFMILLKKNTQHATQSVYSLVPSQDFSSKSDIDWNSPIPEIDAQLYKKYNLSQEEINFIESMIRPME